MKSRLRLLNLTKFVIINLFYYLASVYYYNSSRKKNLNRIERIRIQTKFPTQKQTFYFSLFIYFCHDSKLDGALKPDPFEEQFPPLPSHSVLEHNRNNKEGVLKKASLSGPPKPDLTSLLNMGK